MEKNKATVCSLKLKQNNTGVVWNKPIALEMRQVEPDYNYSQIIFFGLSNKNLLSQIICDSNYYDPSNKEHKRLTITQFSELLKSQGHELKLPAPIEE